MIFWIIILLLLVVLLIPIRCTLSADASGTQVRLKIMLISYTIFPTKKEKAKKEKEQTQKNEDTKKNSDTKKQLRIIYAAKSIIVSSVKKIIAYIAKHAIVIETLNINANIGTGDPADTGIICGGVYSFVYSSIGLLSSMTKLKNHNVRIEPDFDNTILNVSISTTLKTRIIHIFPIVSMLVSLLIKYLRIKKSFERSLNKDHEKRSK